MKKLMLAAALGTFAVTSQAQSSVQLYGLVDAGVTRVTGVNGGRATQLVSGIMDGSRWGLKGNEELGGGYRAIFTLENRFEVDTGAMSNRAVSGSQVPDRLIKAALLLPNQSAGAQALLQPVLTGVSGVLGSTIGVNLGNNLFDRQAFVGLVTPVGAVLAGRQYTPGYEMSATFDIMNTSSSLSAGQLASFPPTVDIRLSNALAYRIQQGPITASLMYSLAEGSASTGRFVGAMGQYKTDAFSFGVGHNTRNNELGNKSLTGTVVGASAAVGPGTVSAYYALIKDDNPSGLSGIAGQVALFAPGAAAFGPAIQNAYIAATKQDAKLMHIGYRYVSGANTIWVAYTSLDDKRPNNADAQSYGVAYSYALSKRTDLNLVATQFKNDGLSQAAPGGAGYLGGVTTSAGTDSNSLAFGVRHRF